MLNKILKFDYNKYKIKNKKYFCYFVNQSKIYNIEINKQINCNFINYYKDNDIINKYYTIDIQHIYVLKKHDNNIEIIKNININIKLINKNIKINKKYNILNDKKNIIEMLLIEESKLYTKINNFNIYLFEILFSINDLFENEEKNIIILNIDSDSCYETIFYYLK